MKRLWILAFSLTFACALSVYAQGGPGGAPQAGAPQGGAPQAGGPGAAPGGGAAGNETVDDQLKSLTTQLGLSKSQQTSARAVLEEKQKLILGVREKYPVAKPGSAPSQEGIAAMTAAMMTSHNKMLAILNEDQKKKYDASDAITPGPGPGAGQGQPGPDKK